MAAAIGNLFDVKGRIALVTGGSSGIGLMIAKVCKLVSGISFFFLNLQFPLSFRVYQDYAIFSIVLPVVSLTVYFHNSPHPCLSTQKRKRPAASESSKVYFEVFQSQDKHALGVEIFVWIEASFQTV